jgi:hypothetical protein
MAGARKGKARGHEKGGVALRRMGVMVLGGSTSGAAESVKVERIHFAAGAASATVKGVHHR